MWSIFILFFLFDSEVLAQNYQSIQVLVPRNRINDVYRALENVPGVELKLVNSDERDRTKAGIDMNYFDDENNANDAQVHNSRRRFSREASHAGYTSDQDTCQMYNHNLIKIWSKFSKYVIPGNHEVPSKMALHNIAQIVEAYLGHQDSYNSENDKNMGSDTNDATDTQPDIDVTEIVKRIKKVMMDTIDEETTGKIIDVIISDVSSAMPEKRDDTCAKRAKERLSTYVSGTFLKYLENATCRRSTTNVAQTNANKVHDKEFTESREVNSMDPKMLRQWQNDYENCEKNAQDKFLHINRLIIQNYMNDLRC